MQQTFTEYVGESSLNLAKREAEFNLNLYLKDYIKNSELQTCEIYDEGSGETYEMPSSYHTSSNVSFMHSYKRRELFHPAKLSEKFDEAMEELKIDVDILNQKYIHIAVNHSELSNEKEVSKQEQLYEFHKHETRRLRKLQKREKAALALRAGVIGGKFGGVKRATMWQINEQVAKNKDTARFLKHHMAVGRAGEQINLCNVFERKMAEFAIVSQGIQTAAEACGMAWAKIVVTAPPPYHINPTHGQYQWDGTMPDELCKKWARQWARCRASLAKQKIILTGIWTRETHGDGTPHLNFILYIPAGSEQVVESVFKEYMALGNKSEKAILFQKMQQNMYDGKCGFAKYVSKGFAKYAAKNIDTYDQGNVDAIAEQCLASAFGWRRWGFFGIPPLSQWRALRSQKNCPNSTTLLDSMWRAARGNRFSDFIILNGGLGATGKTRTMKTHSEKSLSGKSIIVNGVTDKKAGVTLITKTIGYFELFKLNKAKVTVKITDPSCAQNILISIIVKLQTEKGKNWSWPHFSGLIFKSEIEVLKEIADQYYLPAKGSIADAESKMSASILATLKTFCAPIYRMALVCKEIDGIHFSLIDWLNNENPKIKNVILQGDKKDSELSSALARAMVNLSGKHISSIQFGESDTRTSGFWLDEIPQAGKLADIASFLEIGRSKDVFVVIGFCVQFAVDWPSSLVWNTQCICVIVAVT